MILALLFSVALTVTVWAAAITVPCVMLGHIIARALVRLIKGPKE